MINNLYQSLVFGDNSLDEIIKAEKHKRIINDYHKSKEISVDSCTYDNLALALNKAEEYLRIKFETTDKSVVSDYFNEIIIKNTSLKKTPYLSDEKINCILEEHPPTNILDYLSENKDIELDNRTILSLTRFTENDAWQKVYFNILSKTRFEDYYLSKPKCVAIEAKKIIPLLEVSGQTIKPWGVSHSKETGMIILFTNLKSACHTPNLLTLAVFLHYVFEVYYFSLSLLSSQNSPTGETVLGIIKEKQSTFSFLTDGNAHDETLYWRKSIKLLCDETKLDEKLISVHLDKFVITSKGILSLNFIDVLWNINEIYPGENNIYHLQQEAWVNALEQIDKVSGDDFHNKISDSLTLDNATFLGEVLN